nr:hypothetical protein L204_04764 [Cryptococcus depauperatus CBS 7855]
MESFTGVRRTGNPDLISRSVAKKELSGLHRIVDTESRNYSGPSRGMREIFLRRTADDLQKALNNVEAAELLLTNGTDNSRRGEQSSLPGDEDEELSDTETVKYEEEN